MSRVCEICGKKTESGRSICRRGKAKKDKGVGKKTTGITNRKFKPNLQHVKVSTGGGVVHKKVCTQCIREGLVEKPNMAKASKPQ